jgi:hypothetical protein
VREEADHPIALTDEYVGQTAEVLERIFSATRPGVVFGQPVVDVTKLAIAGLTATAAMIATLGRIRRAGR